MTSAMAQPYLKADGLERTYGSGTTAVHALQGASLSAGRGELVAVRGRSGSGKTTLLNIIGGLDRADAGTIRLGGIDVHDLGEEELLRLRRDEVAYVFQSFGLIPILSARENVEVPLRLQQIDPRERGQRAEWALEHVGLAAHAAQRPAELSGGQKQRVGLARALAARPRLLLADEPTGQLDSETGKDIMRLIARLTREEQMTAVVMTHDPAFMSLADRVYEIADGRLTRVAGDASSA